MDKDSGQDEAKNFLREAEDEAALEQEEVLDEEVVDEGRGYEANYGDSGVSGGGNYGGSLNERTRPDGSSLDSGRKGFYGEKKTDKGGLGAKKTESKNEVGKNVGGLNKAEAGAGIKYTGGGKAAALANAAKVATKGKIDFKKGGPIAGIIGLLITGVFAVFGAISLMPANLIEQFNDMFDGSYTSRAWRTPAIMKNAMNGGKWNHAVKKQVKRLEKHGISVVEDGDGSGKFHMEWKNSAGEKMTVDADSFYGELRNNREFRTLYNKATKPVTGRIGAWVDNSLVKFFNKHNLGKNMWADWKNKIGDNMKNRLKALRDTIEKRRGDFTIGQDTQTKSEHDVEGEDEDGDGKPDKTTELGLDESESAGDNETVRRGASVEANRSALMNRAARAAGTVGDAGGVFGIVTGTACAIATANAVLTVIKASITIEDSMNQWQSFAEGSDKARTEDAPYSPVNALATNISQPDKEGNTVLSSMSMTPILSGGSQGIDSDDPALRSTNLEAMYGSIGNTIETVIACAATQMATAAVSFVASTIAIVATGGLAAIPSMFAKGAASMLVQGAVGIGIAAVVGSLASSITSNECNVDVTETEVEADDEGTVISPAQRSAACMALGGSAMLFGNFHFGGGSAGDQDKVAQEYGARQVALEWEAEVDRENFDPLDVTNQNTFMGSLARSVATPIAQMKTPAGIFGALSGTVSDSVASLLPSANAIETAQYIENIKGECSGLEKVGAIGTDSCHAIIITDMDTEEIDPDELDQKLIELGAIDENGNVVSGSNFDKYIKNWVNRETPIGLVDSDILDKESKLITVDDDAKAAWESVGVNIDLIGDIAGTILDALPIIGDAKGAAEAGKQLMALPEAIGQNYVATDGPGKICVDIGHEFCLERDGGWKDEYRYYQRAVEDDRYMQSWDDGYSSKVLAVIDQYEAENPVDNSLEGWLARKTGYPKDVIGWALTEAEYWTYVADYEAPKLEEEKEFDVKNVMPEKIEMPDEVVAKVDSYIVYDDLRSKTYTV